MTTYGPWKSLRSLAKIRCYRIRCNVPASWYRTVLTQGMVAPGWQFSCPTCREMPGHESGTLDGDAGSCGLPQ